MPDVLVLLGSKSDLPIAEKAVREFKNLDISYTVTVASAHRTPERVVELVTGSDAKVFIGIAGLSAALPGVIAAHTLKPVIGVPASGKTPFDSLLSTVQMPPGVPVASVGVDRGDNAALLAARVMSLADPDLAKRLEAYIAQRADTVLSDAKEVEDATR